jgi:RNA polymerase sigma-70 factor (ECF subfamily)
MTNANLLDQARRLLGRHVGLSASDFTQLYASQLRPVLNYVRYRLGLANGEDVTAGIFTKAWQQRARYDPDKGLPKYWLWGIVRHEVVTFWRTHRREALEPLPDDLPAPDNPSAEAERQLERQRLFSAVRLLAPIDQDIIALRFGSGITNRDIAVVIGLSEAAVAQRLRRSLARMRHWLEGELR